MTALLSSASKDLKRWWQDRTALLIWLGIPLLIGTLMTLIFGGGVLPHGVLLIADEDESLVSGMLAGVFGQSGLGDMISVEKVTVDEGRRRIDDGDASAFLTIPAGFGDAVLDAKPAVLTLRTNPSQTIVPGIIRDVVEILLDAGFYAERLFASEIALVKRYDDGSMPDDAAVAAVAVAVQHKLDSAAPHLFPPDFDLTVDEPAPAEPDVSIALLFLPGIVVMSLMFSANGMAGDFWIERESGTLRRIVTAPAQVGGFLAGKVLAAGLVVAALGGTPLVLGFLYHGIGFARLPEALLWLAASGIAMFAGFGVLQMLSRSRRAGNVVTTMLVFPLLMMGGSFFPLDALPEWLAAIGRHTPNGYITDRLTVMLTAPGAWHTAPASWLTIAAMAGGGVFFAAWQLRHRFARA